jgi:hypothetical protein
MEAEAVVEAEGAGSPSKVRRASSRKSGYEGDAGDAEADKEGETGEATKLEEKPWKGLKKMHAARWEVAVNRMHVPTDMLNNNALPASSTAAAQSLLSKSGKGKKGAGKGKKGKGKGGLAAAAVAKAAAAGGAAAGAANTAIWQTMMHVVGAVHFVDDEGGAPAAVARRWTPGDAAAAKALFLSGEQQAEFQYAAEEGDNALMAVVTRGQLDERAEGLKVCKLKRVDDPTPISMTPSTGVHDACDGKAWRLSSSLSTAARLYHLTKSLSLCLEPRFRIST